MIYFIKTSNLESLKTKLIILYLLNVLDWIFTLYLVGTGFFREANIIMAKIIDNYAIGFVLKVLLVAIILMFIYYRLFDATKRQLILSNLLINGIVFIYILINISHLLYISTLI